MKRSVITAIFGACLLLNGVNCPAALSSVEKGYVDQLATGGPLTIRDVAQNLFNSGSTNTEVLDVAAEVLLEKYPQAGEQSDTVDALAWVCRALGKSGDSRYRPVLEQVQNDPSVHRKLRGHCEDAADSLPKKVANPYVAGSVSLQSLRNQAAAGAAPDTAAATVAATLSSGTQAARNPPPARKLQGYSGYELKPVTLADGLADKKNVEKVVGKTDEFLQQNVGPILKEWNAAAAPATGQERLVIAPQIVGVHKPSGANRFFAGAFGGAGYLVMKVTITEQGSGKVIATPEFYRRANAIAGAWSFGAHDNAMMPKIASLLGNYLQANYTQAVGGETGWEP